jgi:hypothetical protein
VLVGVADVLHEDLAARLLALAHRHRLAQRRVGHRLVDAVAVGRRRLDAGHEGRLAGDLLEVFLVRVRLALGAGAVVELRVGDVADEAAEGADLLRRLEGEVCVRHLLGRFDRIPRDARMHARQRVGQRLALSERGSSEANHQSSDECVANHAVRFSLKTGIVTHGLTTPLHGISSDRHHKLGNTAGFDPHHLRGLPPGALGTTCSRRARHRAG